MELTARLRVESPAFGSIGRQPIAGLPALAHPSHAGAFGNQ
jgi:hypothetical protein